MRKRITVKDHQQEIQLITRRVIVALFAMAVLLGVMIFRLSYLQIDKHNLYTTLAQKNRFDLVPAEPTRGLIFDRNGLLLAENIPVFSLDIIPNKVANLPQTLSDLGKIIDLSPTDLAQFDKQLRQHRRFDEIPLKLRLYEQEVARFAEEQYRFPGVLIKARLLRHYPFADKMVHILGFVGRINTKELSKVDPINYSATNYIGKVGIEKYYENELHGTVGYEQVENDASGHALRTVTSIAPIPGKNLYLSIDSHLQLSAEDAMQGIRGALVAIDPHNGEILALVSEPGYDPNVFVTGISNQDFQKLRQSPDQPLYNRAIRGAYPIGSTIKPFLALQGLETGTATAEGRFFDPGWFKLKNSTHVFHDMKRGGHGWVNIIDAITVSCDTFFYDLANKLGITRIDDILNRFGFGSVTGIDMREEVPGNIPSPASKMRLQHTSWYPGDTVNSGIGQGFMQATPLQLAMATSALAEKGLRYTPHIINTEQQPGKAKTLLPIKPLPPVTLQNKAAWETVIAGMQGVVTSQHGTGYRFGTGMPYTIAAKTGTAQVYTKNYYDETGTDNQKGVPEKLRDHHLFIAFAPVENPKIAIAVLTENSNLAVNVARKVLDAYLAPPPVVPVPALPGSALAPTSTAPTPAPAAKTPTTEKKL